ncbi:hypothetical protein OH491_17465 [Termitidicoccus mucosus]|uniref:Uncharacterized protein n=1 Tax=Termitidicoccus mucosus TaxID=1184151 RepID=A0A178IKT6_9BACT|nr:hypothetical protein AW736_11130 [Opitutaceae bacterium TSB47]
MAESTNNNTAVSTGSKWTSILDKGIEILPELLGITLGKQTSPTAQPTSLNAGNPASTGTAAATGVSKGVIYAAAGTAAVVIAILGVLALRRS